MLRASKTKAAMNTARRYAKRYAEGGPVDQYTTQLTPDEQAGYQSWKQKYAPRDSGYDYDLQGAYRAGFTPDPITNHFDDRFKKPNHPTFSIYSQYAKDRPDLAGTWDGDQYVPPATAHYAQGGDVDDPVEMDPLGNPVGAPKVAEPGSIKPTRMEPDLQSSQMGHEEVPEGYMIDDAGQMVSKTTGETIKSTRRPNVLPITRNQEGRIEFAMPKVLDVVGNAMPATIGSMLTRGVAAKAGEMVLGAGAAAKAKPIEAAKPAMSLEDEIGALVKDMKAPKVDDPHAILDSRKFQPVSESQGTMPGGWRVDPADGTKWYIKEAPSIQQAANEKLTAELYKASGVPVADVRLTTVNGKPGIASKAIEGDQLTHVTDPYHEVKELHDNYVIDAVLGNHDAVGTGPENPLGNIIVDKKGVAHRIDTGGGLSFKGTGQPKTAGFGYKADELSTMKDPKYSHLSAEVFSGISDEALQAGAQKLLKINPANDWWPLIEKFGPAGDKAKIELFNKLTRRRQDALDKILKDPFEQKPWEPTYDKYGLTKEEAAALDELESWKPEPEWQPPTEAPSNVIEPSSSFWSQKIAPMSLNKNHVASDYVNSLKNAPGLQSSTDLTAKQVGNIGKNFNAQSPEEIADAILAHQLSSDQIKTIYSWLKPAKEAEVDAMLSLKMADDTHGIPTSMTEHVSNLNPKPQGTDIYSANRDPLKDPKWTAKQIVESNGKNPHDVAHDFFDIAMKDYSYADEVFKHLPVGIADDVNASLEDLIKHKRIDPWNKPPEANIPLQARISQAFEKLDWSKYNPLKKTEKLEVPNLKKAKAAGFNDKLPLYKGGFMQDYPQEIFNVMEKGNNEKYGKPERAFFISDSKQVAGHYGKTMPYLARADKAFVVDWPSITGGSKSYENQIMHSIIEEGHARKADVLVIRNINDLGGTQDQYAFLNPAALRAPHAAFDKSKLKLAHPLAGLAGGGLFSYEMLKGNEKDDTKMARGGSIAGALRHAKRYAAGGGTDTSFFEHSAFKQSAKAGMIHSPIPGRTDKIPMGVKGGSYVMPADVVSGLGQGNSTAGAVALNKLFGQSPYGAAAGKAGTPRINYGKMKGMRSPRMRADGGDTPGEEKPVPVIVAGGEYLVDPETVKRLGGGDMKHGHEILDNLVLHLRKKTIKDMQGLKPPKRS